MSLPKYVVNFDELIDQLKQDLLSLINDAIRNNYPQLNFNNIESALENIKLLLPTAHYQNLKKVIDAFMYRKVTGDQKINGALLDVPPIIQTVTHKFMFDHDVYLTGLHFNQTGWKKEDLYSLEINKNKIIDHAAIKEVGEHKHFNTFFKIRAKTPIYFMLDNNSGNSRQTLIDLEYIESVATTPPTPNQDITIDNIPNEWDFAVVMNWEDGSHADVDLHGIMDNTHVYFGNPGENNLYLNFDFQDHVINNNPEILSVKGNKDKRLQIYIHNYNGIQVMKPVSIKIYHKGVITELVKEYNVLLSSDKQYINGVCTIDLSNSDITDLNNKIRVINGGF